MKLLKIKFFPNIGLWLLLAAVFLWTINLGGVALRDWDEGYYALVARQMYRTGNFLYPLLHDKPFDKPPLGEWLIAASYYLFGVSEFSTRLPLAFFSAWGVPLIYWIGREIFTNPITNKIAAIFSALVYLTLLPVVRHGRLAMHDGITVTLFLLLLLSLLKIQQNKLWALVPGLAFGLLILARGEMALVLGAIAILYLFLDQRLSLLKIPDLWLGLIITNIPIIAWYVIQGQQYGGEFWQGRLFGPLLTRIVQPFHNHDGPPWYYILELIKYSFPWLIFLPQSLILTWQNRRSSWGKLILAGLIVYGLIISIMRTKLPWYIMPIYPFIALSIGVKLADIWSNRQAYPQIWQWLLSLPILVGLGGCVYFTLTNQISLIPLAISLILVFAGVVWLINQQQPKFILTLFIGVYIVLTIFVNSPVWVWELNENFKVKPVADLIKNHTPVDTIIYTSFSYSRPSLDFYSDRQIKSAAIDELKARWLQQSYLLLDSASFQSLQLSHSKSLGSAEDFTLIVPAHKN
ncbi:MAG TPA: glycosyltransferase family 39 protein [Nostocaceae cyanobacterium]|nr:glycosyltransferase family 39 protein [Nostocaceae cyanobacterium]